MSAAVIAALSLLAGVLLGLASAAVPPGICQTIGVAVAVAALTCLRYHALARGLAMVLLGLVLAGRTTNEWQRLRIEPASRDTRVLLEGRVLDVPARAGSELRFDAEVRVVGHGAVQGRMRRARLAWREPPAEPRVGEQWRWLARVEPLAERRNFTGLETARLAFRDDVHLVARVLPSRLDVRLAPAGASIDGARSRIAERVRASIADPDAAALVTALAVGLTDDVTPDQWRVFNATGTTHLVAISGLHITLFALLMFAAARRLWRWLPVHRHVARETFAGVCGLAAAGAYSLLAGLSVPSLRTWLMLATFAGARLVARHVAPARVWSLALIVVLLVDPRAPLAAGFWLSFVAVGVILALAAPARAAGWRAQTTAALRLQFAIMVALAPLTVAVFSGISVGGFIVNLVAIPFVSFVFVPLVLAGAMAALCASGLARMLFALAEWLYLATWPALTAAADLGAPWRVAPSLTWFVLAGCAVMVALHGGAATLRWTAACALLPLLFPPSRLPPPGIARIIVFDMGRGAATLVLTHSQVWLFDTGDAWHTDGARVRQVVMPALDALGIRRVDRLVLPSLTPERAAAAALLAEERGLAALIVGGGWPASRLRVARCADAAVVVDGVRLETVVAGERQRACALRVTAGGHSLLIAGDLDAAAERVLARRRPDVLANEVLVISREASDTGSSPQWIEASTPGLAVATGGIAGAATRAAALARWRAHGIAMLDTHDTGALDLVLGTRGIERLECAGRAVVSHRWPSQWPFPWPFVWRRAP